MGFGLPAAIGAALAAPQATVLCFTGDGSLLMNLGTLVTVAAAAPENLIHFVSRNGNYEANGGHPIPAQGILDFAGIARSAGYRHIESFSALPAFAARAEALLNARGPTFVELHLEAGDAAPAPDYAHIHGERARREFALALAKGQPAPACC